MSDVTAFDWLIRRETVIAFAVVGGVLSLAGWTLSLRRPSGTAAAWCNRAAYAFMAVSILLFIAAGMVRR